MILKHVIQSGNQGSIYLGEYEGLVVAIKKINKENNPHWEKEIRILNKIDSKYIVKIHAIKTDENFVYHIMEHIGKDLYDVISHGLTEEETIKYLKNITLGVKYLHDNNIMHRDIKPENILVDDFNNTKICDFGHSIQFKNEEKFNKIRGTIYYFAPEIVKRRNYDYRIDIWCLGILYYEMIAKYPPFYSEDEDKVYKLIRRNNIIFPQFFPKRSEENILKILKSEPEDRISLLQILDF